MKPDALIKKLRDARSDWVGLPHPDFPDLKVKVERPAESEFPAVVRTKSLTECAAQFVTDWSGMSEAVFLGQAVGSTDPIPFDKALWAFVSADQADWVFAVNEKLSALMNAHAALSADNEKN